MSTNEHKRADKKNNFNVIKRNFIRNITLRQETPAIHPSWYLLEIYTYVGRARDKKDDDCIDHPDHDDHIDQGDGNAGRGQWHQNLLIM